jgi:hypothetical protein
MRLRPEMFAWHHRNAIDRAGCNTQIAARTVIREHRVHAFIRPHDGIYWTGRYAQGATDAIGFVDHGNF